jgi:hypothetical protein
MLDKDEQQGNDNETDVYNDFNENFNPSCCDNRVIKTSTRAMTKMNDDGADGDR